jgi:hypothetical protein
MFAFFFNLLIRTIGIPVVAIWLLGNSNILTPQGAFLAVCIVDTIITVPLAIWHGVKVLPNLALIRGKRVVELIIEIVFEIVCVIGIWLVYLSLYNR